MRTGIITLAVVVVNSLYGPLSDLPRLLNMILSLGIMLAVAQDVREIWRRR